MRFLENGLEILAGSCRLQIFNHGRHLLDEKHDHFLPEYLITLSDGIQSVKII